jgi:heptosyltransferase-2
LLTHGYSSGDLLVAVHPGGSSRLKRWSIDSFEAMADTAAQEFGARILWLVDPSGTGADATLPNDAIRAKPSLRELIALLSRCDLLVCNDGGPMHLAAALGISTFAVYSWGKPEWWRPPFGSVRHAWIQRDDITCRPCAGHCIFPEPICLTGLTLGTALTALRTELRMLRSDGGARIHASSL